MTTLHSHSAALSGPDLSLVSKLRRVSQLRINIVSGVFTNGINVVVMAVSYPLYLYYLGYDKLGLWLLHTFVQSFAQLGFLGFGPALTKLVAEETGRGNQSRSQSYILQAAAVLLLTGAIAVLTLCIRRRPIIGAMGLGESDSAAALSLLS